MVAAAPIPSDEGARLEALHANSILDTAPDERFDLFTRLCTWLFDVPVAAINFVDADRTFFKSLIGFASYAPARATSICAHAIAEPDPIMVVDDLAQDERFHDHPLVVQKGIRFYAGAILRSNNGQALGTICVGDVKPRAFSADERRKLVELANGVGAVLDLHRNSLLLFHAASQDSLTGLCSRRFFTEKLQSAVAQAHPDNPCGLLCLDLDGFKRVNDTHGHAGGDALLGEVGRRLASVVRSVDTVARLGGDEFAVLLHGPVTEEGTAKMAERILDAFAQYYEFEGTTISIRTSIGIALCGDPGTDAAGLLRAADTALYQAKQAGRGQYKTYQSLAAVPAQ